MTARRQSCARGREGVFCLERGGRRLPGRLGDCEPPLLQLRGAGSAVCARGPDGRSLKCPRVARSVRSHDERFATIVAGCAAIEAVGDILDGPRPARREQHRIGTTTLVASWTRHRSRDCKSRRTGVGMNCVGLWSGGSNVVQFRCSWRSEARRVEVARVHRSADRGVSWRRRRLHP